MYSFGHFSPNPELALISRNIWNKTNEDKQIIIKSEILPGRATGPACSGHFFSGPASHL
jgi:hypothetical protein